ncbi:MAG: UDP-N-acetylmuramate--L-alanine ligase [Oscillospiraceae bacterium]|nr:UDP-N-acetylmuramate--L-alanine ligase [Oscillospiraceae bacterium]
MNWNKDLLKDKKHLHFIGCGGSGMFPIIQILHAAGYTITGSDVNEGDIIRYEREMGITVTIPHDAACVEGADLVVYSAAISRDNPEWKEAERLGIPCVERSVMLGYVASLYAAPVCVAGTHGKTSTTAMLTQTLLMAGRDPAAVIGGKLPYIDGYGRSGSGDTIVVESCEYHNTFFELLPHTAVLLNVDADHLEFFGNMENLKAAFARFCNAATDTVIYNGDDTETLDTMRAVQVPHTVSFGEGEKCDYRAVNVREPRPGFYAFDVVFDGCIIACVTLGVPGRHHVYNALASFAVCHRAGCEVQDIVEGIGAFGGAGRRFEIVGEKNGVTVVDDYAHHPTEVGATLRAARKLAFRSVWAVHQPFTYSRTQMLLDEFAEVLQLADHVVLTQIMGSRERAEDHTVRTADLAAKIPGSVWFETKEEAADYVMQHAQPGDLVITLGCGDIYKAARRMLQA